MNVNRNRRQALALFIFMSECVQSESYTKGGTSQAFWNTGGKKHVG